MINTEIAAATKIMLGTTEAVAMYIGSTKVWPIGQLLHNYANDYFTVESLQDSNTISLTKVKNCSVSPTLYYSTDNGSTWSSVSATSSTTNIATINTGDKLLIKSTNTNLSTAWDTYNKLNGSKLFKVYGNVMSLLNGDNFITNSDFANNSTNNLCGLFYGVTTIIDASDLILPATICNQSCYNGMFRGATNLAYGPKDLPGVTLYLDSYSSMFEGCINLEEAPIIHAMNFNGTGSMMRMFCMNRSSKITTPKLTKGPVLPATTLGETTYKEMFKGNGNLIEVTCLAETRPSGSTDNWFTNCSSTGTFYKSANTTWGTSTSGILSGWTIVDYVLS